MYEHPYSQQELHDLRAHAHCGGPGMQDAWSDLITGVQAAMQQGMAPQADAAQALGLRWINLLRATTGKHIDLALKLSGMRAEDSAVTDITGVTPALAAWIGRAAAAARASLFAAHLTPAELATVSQRLDTHTPAWPELVYRLRQLRDNDHVFSDAPVQALAVEWISLFHASFCGNDTALEAKVHAVLRQEPALMHSIGVDPSLKAYIQRAIMHRQHPLMLHTDMETPKPSALLAAKLRAVHQIIDQPLIFADPLALAILGPAQEADLRQQLDIYADSMSAVLRTLLVVRSRLADDEWKRSGARQYVVLGAGLDTSAYRINNIDDAALFEVDLPATQQWKRQMLQQAGIAEPAALTYVAADLEHANLTDSLTAAGFKMDQPAFFSWLGVTPYLSEADVLQTLAFISDCAPGTTVVFDYRVVRALLTPAEAVVSEFISTNAEERGEPWKNAFDPVTLAARLLQLGYSTVENYSMEQLTQRYLAGRTDCLRLGGVLRLMRAVV